MLPDHLRALRTTGVLCLIATVPSLVLGLALIGHSSWAPGFAFVAATCTTLGGMRCAMAFDAARRRRQM